MSSTWNVGSIPVRSSGRRNVQLSVCGYAAVIVSGPCNSGAILR